MFRVNPEEFIVKTAALIVDEKARMVVEHIRYNRVAGTYDAAEIFAEDMPENLGRALSTSRHGVQDWTVFDSDTEREFARELEESAEVCAFAHLPRSFKIPTARTRRVGRGVCLRAPAAFIQDSHARGRLRARLGHRLQRGRGEAHLLHRRDQGVAQVPQPQGRREGQNQLRSQALRAARPTGPSPSTRAR